jgi:hypothetical protein
METKHTKPRAADPAQIKRMWVNQPSMLQPFHRLHGVRVLAVAEYDDTMRVYFTSGRVISQQMNRLCLSDGWPETAAPDLLAALEESTQLLKEIITGKHRGSEELTQCHRRIDLNRAAIAAATGGAK